MVQYIAKRHMETDLLQKNMTDKQMSNPGLEYNLPS